MAKAAHGALIVGTGFGVLTHLRALRAAGVAVCGLVGRDPEKTARRAQMAGVERALTSLEEGLALPDVDIVTVATPPHSHAGIVLAAIDAGKHVLCEKPFARDLAEAREMQEAADAKGIVHLLGTEFRYATGQALAARAIREGVIGEPRLATFMMHVPVLADPDGEVPGWWSDRSAGGGWLGAYASHIIDQIRMTLGEIAGVSASLTLVSDREWSAEDSYTIHFRTVSGVDGVLQSSAGCWGMPLIATRFAGSQGTLWLEGEGVKVADGSGVRTLEVPAELEMPPSSPPSAELMKTTYDHLHAGGFDLGPYTRLIEVMRDRIDGLPTQTDPPPATFADGVAGQAVLDAVRESAQSGRWVDIA